MIYYRGKYCEGDGTAIWCDTDNHEPYATVSINLIDYGFVPPENQIVVPLYKLSEEAYQQFKRDVVKCEIRKVPIGYGEGVLVELRDDWKEICKEA